MSVSVNANQDSKYLTLNDLQRTGLAKGEATFADYFKQLKLNKDGTVNEAGVKLLSELGGDKDIQNEVAELYKERSNVSIDKLQKLLADKGIKVSSEWVTGVNHMADQKAVGVGNEQVSNGLTVITFEKDGKTFKVADANGNAALESEELMFNEILSGVNSDLSAMANGSTKAVESTENKVDIKSALKDLEDRTEKKTQKENNSTEESEIDGNMNLSSMLSLYDSADSASKEKIQQEILSITGYASIDVLRSVVNQKNKWVEEHTKDSKTDWTGFENTMIRPDSVYTNLLNKNSGCATEKDIKEYLSLN